MYPNYYSLKEFNKSGL